MNVVLQTSSQSVALTSDRPIAIDLEQGIVVPYETVPTCRSNSVLLCPTETRGLVVIMRDGSGSLIVNGRRVYGFCSIASTSIIRARSGNHALSFAIVFDDAVIDIPAGAVCDICGRSLAETGKGHCRRKLCTDCIETFAAKCPDCGKDLTGSDTTNAPVKAMQEFFIAA